MEAGGAAYSNVQDLLQETFSCQHCGRAFSWTEIQNHENKECSQRPSKGAIPLPHFDLPDTPSVHRFQNTFPTLDPTPSESVVTTSTPSAINVKAIFEKYHESDKFTKGASFDAASRVSRHFGSWLVEDVADETATIVPCLYCGLQFPRDQLAHRLIHQRICASNPSGKIPCVYCGLEFKSNIEMVALEQVALHEDVCKANPRTMCKHCGQKCGGSIEEGLKGVEARLRSHAAVCPLNPHNHAACRFCGREFRSNDVVPAYLHCDKHTVNCEFNPRNSCRFCGLRFNGEIDSVKNSAVMRRRAHEARCPIRAQAKYGQHQPRQYFFRSSTSTQPQSHERKIINEIQEELKGLSREQLRRHLRQLQLKWHPDKHASSPDVALSVFRFIQSVWDKNFKKS